MTDVEELVRTSLKAAPSIGPLAPWQEIESHAQRARRARWMRRALVICGVTVTLAAVLLFSDSFDHSGPSPLARASAAIVDWPPNQILYTRVLMVSNFDQPDAIQESWQLTSPPYTRRTRDAFPAGASGAQVVESATDATGLGQGYDWRSNEVIQTTDTPAEWRPSGVSQQTREELQADLNNDHWKSLGESDVDGHHVLGFEGFGTDRLYLDSTTYLPVLNQSFGYGVGDERRGYDQHYTWQLLPTTQQNLDLLDIAKQHPDAAVVPLPGPAWRAIEGQLGGLMKPPITPGA